MGMAKSSVARVVRDTIRRAGPDRIWTYSDFASLPPLAVAAALSRLAKKGGITRVRKGVYYVPKETRFGKTAPDPQKLVAAVLKSRGIAWRPTGLAMYNVLGLTSQVSPVATFAADRPVRSLRLPSNIRVQFRWAPKVARTSAQERAVLDALRDLRSIPGSSETEVLRRITQLFSSGVLSFERVARLAEAEPPRVRALLGAMGAQIPGTEASLRSLKESLNPLTKFRIGVGQALPAAKVWNIT